MQKRIEIEIKGVAPLLQHRFPEEEHGEHKKRGKKQVYKAEEEAKKALYKNEDGIYQPSEHILGALIRAAVGFKYEGKKTYKDIVRGNIIIEPDVIPLVNEKDERKQTWDEIDTRNVVVGKARIMRWRPKFNAWKLNFQALILDSDVLSLETLKDILEAAGNVGIGDYRPRFGRFMITRYQEVAETHYETVS